MPGGTDVVVSGSLSELVSANGEPTSTVADPDYFSEREAIEAIHEAAPTLYWCKGYGWVGPDPAAPTFGR